MAVWLQSPSSGAFISLPHFSHTLNPVRQWKCFRVRTMPRLSSNFFFFFPKLWFRNFCFQWYTGTSWYWSWEHLFTVLSSVTPLWCFGLGCGRNIHTMEISKATNLGYFFSSSTELSYQHTKNWTELPSLPYTIYVHFSGLLASFGDMSPSSKIFAIPLHFILPTDVISITLMSSLGCQLSWKGWE